uniref:CFAP65 fourth Ig-like domain-containing protein n=1 Tax=Echeneis naucrates TaxID=173247 RepID=A0A665V765_ECHNA
ITLKVVYKPGQPITHYRRVACIILHRDPLFLDLIGTCHSELQKPAILKPEHLVLYKLHWNRRQDPSEICSVMQKDKNVHLDHQLLHSALEEVNAAVPKAPMEEFYQICLGCTDPLFSSSSSSPHISVVPCELLFDHKILVWTVAQDSPFTVSPSSCDLASLKTTSFRVTYDPKQINTLHGAQLECFAYYKMVLAFFLQFHWALLSAWQGALHPVLLSEALSSGETPVPEKLQYRSIILSICLL